MFRARVAQAIRCVSTMSTTPVEDAMRMKVNSVTPFMGRPISDQILQDQRGIEAFDVGDLQ